MLRSPTKIIAVIALAAACALAANGQVDNPFVSVTISNRSDRTLALTLLKVTKLTPAPPPWKTDSSAPAIQAPSASHTNLNANQVRSLAQPLSRELAANHSTTIEISAGEYSIAVATSPPSSPQDPAPGRRELISGQALHHLKTVSGLNGYLSVTNNECWVFSTSFDKEFQERGYSIQLWMWDLQVPSRPGFKLSLTPEPTKPPVPPPMPSRAAPPTGVRS